MVESNFSLDLVFSSLADATRRDIVRRVAKAELSVSEIAQAYNLTLAAVSKHLKVLEKARLIVKHRRGKQQFVTASPETLHDAAEYLLTYQELWEERFEQLEDYLRTYG